MAPVSCNTIYSPLFFAKLFASVLFASDEVLVRQLHGHTDFLHQEKLLVPDMHSFLNALLRAYEIRIQRRIPKPMTEFLPKKQ